MNKLLKKFRKFGYHGKIIQYLINKYMLVMQEEGNKSYCLTIYLFLVHSKIMKLFSLYRRKAIKYFGNHVEYNALVHVLGGIGLGILISTFFSFPFSSSIAIFLLVLSLIGHFYTLVAKK